MIRETSGESVFVTVVSSGRPERVEPTTASLGDATWVVPEDQMHDYVKAGAPAVASDPGGNVAVARNVALDLGDGAPVAILDDDFLRGWHVADDGERAIKLDEALAIIVERASMSDLPLAAARRGANVFYARGRKLSTRATIFGGLLLVKPNDLRFDDRLSLSEDVDYGIQHVNRYGGALRVNEVLLDFATHASGGVQRYRSADLTRETVGVLLQKWGPRIVRVRENDSEIDPLHVRVVL